MGGQHHLGEDFREETKTTTQGGGKGGWGRQGQDDRVSQLRQASPWRSAKGPITGIGRIWADGKPMDLSGVTWRLVSGDEDPDGRPVHPREVGGGQHPAYRGTAYVVFEELALSTMATACRSCPSRCFRPLGRSRHRRGG